MANKIKSTIPSTKGNEKDLKLLEQSSRSDDSFDSSYKELSLRGVKCFNNHALACQDGWIVPLISRTQTFTFDMSDDDQKKKRSASLVRDEVTDQFRKLIDSTAHWSVDERGMEVPLNLIDDEKTSAIYFAVVLQRLIKTRFKRVKWDELLVDFGHEMNEYEVGILYHKYGTLCYGFCKLRVNSGNLTYAYSEVGCSFLSEKTRFYLRSHGESAYATALSNMRRDMMEDYSKFLDMMKADPDRTLNVSQTYQEQYHQERETDEETIQIIK